MNYPKKYVYKLVHMYECKEEDEIKELGIYSTYKKAKEAIGRYKVLEGFNKYPIDCFYINKCEIDRDAEWVDGFINSTIIEQNFSNFSKHFEIWLQSLETNKYTLTDFNFETNKEFLYNLECEIYETICSMEKVEDITNHIRKIFEKRFGKTEITLEQYMKLASTLLTQGDGFR